VTAGIARQAQSDSDQLLQRLEAIAARGDPADLAAMYRIFDDKRHPSFYEHQLAA
jgi:hypothetical protein